MTVEVLRQVFRCYPLLLTEEWEDEGTPAGGGASTAEFAQKLLRLLRFPLRPGPGAERAPTKRS